MKAKNDTDVFQRLRQLSDRLHAAATISAVDNFPQWHPDIKQFYMRMIERMSGQLRDELQKIASDFSSQEEQKRHRG